MIRHIVLFKLRNGADAPEIFAALKALQAVIPGIKAISCGTDASPEGLQQGNTHGFTVDFENAAARDAYLPHPTHQKVGGMILAAALGGLAGITVVDWET